ncbi:unnamed protein product [Ambrosiozyma monospora]|uniref:Unnamed protein product n=1 Tax=Ambrosiozyma monospora TaxID=43982 RepID=A0ACB5U9T5_AMBMO|nr:unnamed protein product [Ambrosiozyma monospora]
MRTNLKSVRRKRHKKHFGKRRIRQVNGWNGSGYATNRQGNFNTMRYEEDVAREKLNSEAFDLVADLKVYA